MKATTPKVLACAIALIASVSLAMTPARSADSVAEQDAYEIGVEAYTYLYSLVLMDATRRQAVNVEAGKAIGRGPMNVFTHVPIFPPADFRDVVRPNFDTLYSIAWLDLTKEPMVVTALTRRAASTCYRCSICGQTYLLAPANARQAPAQVASESCRHTGMANFPKAYSA